jgi:hypothetical protein
MELHVDRLTLRLAALSEPDARRLVRLVAEHLATADAPGGPLALDHVRLQLSPLAGESLDASARRIASDLLRALARSSW